MLKENCKPKSNLQLVATKFKIPQQGGLSLPEFITKDSLLCDQCEYLVEAKHRLLHNAIVMGGISQKAYYKCTEKYSNLTIVEALHILQSEGLTQCQVDSCRPSPTTTDLHKCKTQQQQHQQKGHGEANQSKSWTVSRLID